MSTERNDGGPAFPQITRLRKEGSGGHFTPQYDEGGISLRDYFAAKAMQAFISRADIAQAMSDYADGYYDEKVAQWAYESADAMLKRRQS